MSHSRVHRSTVEGKTSADGQIDWREQMFNTREVGPVESVQLPTEAITTLHGIVHDLDLHLYRTDSRVPLVTSTAKKFVEQTLGPILGRHPALVGAEVRSTGRNVHVLIWFREPIVFVTDGERRRWSGIVQAVQAALPIDPDQPGITALTRPVGSVNSKTGRRVRILKSGSPVPVAEVLRLYDQMVRSPFRTVMGLLLGAERVTPCPVCGAEGSALAALDQGGRCYGSCGTVSLEQLYDLFLAPRPAKGKEARDGRR